MDVSVKAFNSTDGSFPWGKATRAWSCLAVYLHSPMHLHRA